MTNRIRIKQIEIQEKWQYFLDFITQRTDSILLTFAVSKKKAVMNFVNRYFPDSVIDCVEFEKDGNALFLELYLKISDATCSWLCTQDPFSIKMEGVLGEDAIGLSFCKDEAKIIFSSCYNTAYSWDRKLDKEFEEFVLSIRRSSVPHIYYFIDRYYAYKKDIEKESLNTYYSDIDIRALTEIFDREYIHKFDLLFFYDDIDVMETIAKLLVEKAKNGTIKISRLYEWFMLPTKNRNNETIPQNEISGIEIIVDYLRSLSQQDFLDSFPYHSDKFNKNYMDKISFLWNERNLESSKFGDADIMRIIELWGKDDITCSKTKEHIFSLYFNMANKYASREDRLKAVYSIRRKKRYRSQIEQFYGRAEILYLYFYGIFVNKDLLKAFRLLKIKSEENNSDCQYDLARCYLNGWGTEKDIEQAKYWFGKAAENGHPKAQEQLDLITENKV